MDKNGVIWFVESGNLYSLENNEAFFHGSYNPNIYVDDENVIWITSLEYGLMSYNGEEWESRIPPSTIEMNGFVICVGCYVKSLTELALQIGEKIGPLTADLGDNACQIPFAPDYIRKVQKRGTIGKKRKTVKC